MKLAARDEARFKREEKCPEDPRFGEIVDVFVENRNARRAERLHDKIGVWTRCTVIKLTVGPMPKTRGYYQPPPDKNILVSLSGLGVPKDDEMMAYVLEENAKGVTMAQPFLRWLLGQPL